MGVDSIGSAKVPREPVQEPGPRMFNSNENPVYKTIILCLKKLKSFLYSLSDKKECGFNGYKMVFCYF